MSDPGPDQDEIDRLKDRVADEHEPSQDGDERTFMDPDGDGEIDPHEAEPSGL